MFGFGRDAPASAELSVRAPVGDEQRQVLQIAPRDLQIQRIDGLPPREVSPSEADLARISADSCCSIAPSGARRRGGASPSRRSGR